MLLLNDFHAEIIIAYIFVVKFWIIRSNLCLTILLLPKARPCRPHYTMPGWMSQQQAQVLFSHSQTAVINQLRVNCVVEIATMLRMVCFLTLGSQSFVSRSVVRTWFLSLCPHQVAALLFTQESTVTRQHLMNCFVSMWEDKRVFSGCGKCQRPCTCCGGEILIFCTWFTPA